MADGGYRAYAYNEAIDAYTRALELGGQDAIATEQLKHIYLQRGRAMELNNQFELALQNYEAMLTAAQIRQDRSMQLAAKVAASTLYSTPTSVADEAKGRSLSEETLLMARELGDRPAEARVPLEFTTGELTPK